ncbi:hypothetical protein BU23DRAFT_198232 [Bimuria novae-zelandiae CBS 107.79]|uniref:Uncharacterized protein n=1 Tax=Bimuria novae-zelandiae CBS 107.79 TaxID=1447943 RepID=A0A6A5V2A6_9PLEO|nr:hypothetical protein BU23DRAFT_198232 [Bimuria novae-zelandiae CBS 107.79]
MDFDAFQTTAKALPDLTEEESGDIMRLLQHGQKQAQKPFRTKYGPRGRVLGPIVLSKDIPNETLNTEDRYFFYSLPYFCLNKYVELNVSSHSNLQPTRTLLQIRDPSTSKGREFEQAICQLSGTPSGHCFHLSTLWCLVIKDKYIMTCSLHSGTELSGELLDILKRPPSQPSAVVRDRPQVLRVILENALYLIPINECDSWFKFTQKFSVLHNDFDDVYTVYLNERRIESGQWHIVIRQARKLTTQTRVIVSMKPHILNRPLNKPLLASDDAAEIAASRPSTPNRGGESTASITGLRKTGSIREEEEEERPARGRSDDSTARLKAPLSPGLRSPDSLKRPPPTSIISFESYLQDFHALRWIAVKFIDSLDPDSSANSGKDVPKITHPKNNRPRKS